VKVTRRTVWVPRSEVRMRTASAWAVYAVGAAILVTAIVRDVWWGWWIALAVYLAMAAVYYSFSLRFRSGRTNGGGDDKQ